MVPDFAAVGYVTGADVLEVGSSDCCTHGTGNGILPVISHLHRAHKIVNSHHPKIRGPATLGDLHKQTGLGDSNPIRGG